MPPAAIVAVAVCALALALTGCGTSSSGSSGSSAGSRKLVLIQGTKADNFSVTMGCGARAEAKKLGYSISVQGPTAFSASEQIAIVNSVIASKPAAVLIAPAGRRALIAPMQSMKSAGIKVIQVDTTVDDPSIAAASISSDNLKGGELAAQTLAKETGGKGSVVVIDERAGVSTTEARIKGFMTGIRKYPDISVLPNQSVGDNPGRASSAITALHSAHPGLSGVFATNLIVAQGVATGLRTAGASHKVKIVGYGADPTEIQDLKRGVVDSLVAPEPYQEGVDGVEQAVNAIEGKPTRNILTSAAVLTRSNLPATPKFIEKGGC